MELNQFFYLFKEPADVFKKSFPDLAMKFFEEQYIRGKQPVAVEPPPQTLTFPFISSLRLSLKPASNSNSDPNPEPISNTQNNQAQFEYLDRWP